MVPRECEPHVGRGVQRVSQLHAGEQIRVVLCPGDELQLFRASRIAARVDGLRDRMAEIRRVRVFESEAQVQAQRADVRRVHRVGGVDLLRSAETAERIIG